MTWQVSGRGLEICSCKMFCPCWLGPQGEPDEGWCAAAFAYEFSAGDSEGVDLGGTRAFMMAWWPANFFHGKGKARLYIGEGASADQARELEAILAGGRKSFLSDLWGAVIDEWLPAKTANIEIALGDKPGVTVAGVGETTLEPVTNGAGTPTVISGAMAQAGFHIDSMQLAIPGENQWSDPDLQDWSAADGVLYDIAWSG